MNVKIKTLLPYYQAASLKYRNITLHASKNVREVMEKEIILRATCPGVYILSEGLVLNRS